MKEPPLCMKRATEKAMSSAGLYGTAPPNSGYLINYVQIHTHYFCSETCLNNHGFTVWIYFK